jgi:hypothetical protein
MAIFKVLTLGLLLLLSGCSIYPTIQARQQENILLAQPVQRRVVYFHWGYLQVSDQRILFQPVQPYVFRHIYPTLDIPLSQIVRIEKRTNLYGQPVILGVETKDGKRYRFAAGIIEREQLIEAINQVQARKEP